MAQALVDFVWYVPACMAIIAILGACALRLSQLANIPPGFNTLPRMTRSMAAIILLIIPLLGTWMIHNRIGPALASPYWNQYLLQIAQDGAQDDSADDSDTKISAESAVG
ncbi:MAG: hypothetical protein ACWGMZ_11120, partial [Thermoguttaceae bacterium]